MDACVNGRWVVGMAHADPSLPATIAAGVFDLSTFSNDSLAPTASVGVPAVSAAQCLSLVSLHFPDADGAQYSNVGKTECFAVYNASGVVYDYAVQTCMFAPQQAQQQGRRLRTTAGEEGDVVGQSEVQEMRRELQEVKAMLSTLLARETNRVQGD